MRLRVLRRLSRALALVAVLARHICIVQAIVSAIRFRARIPKV
jgi:hypothetical protein